jgi:ribonuclease D
MITATIDSLPPPVIIQSPEQFEGLVQSLGGQAQIAVDTESNSLHAYRERVCLIQFSTPAADYILDPLALDDLSPLAPIFVNPSIEKIFHASEYDIICLRRDYGFTFSNLFDTMLAGRILGRKLAGLDRLLEDKFGLKVNKRFQKADWRVRPLPFELLLYARLDTHFLIPLSEMLKTELEEKGLWQLAEEDFRMACFPNESKPKPVSPGWTRLSGRRDLTPRDVTILSELIVFRERLAARMDRPPFKVMQEDKLIAIARAKPSTIEDLNQIGLTSGQVQNWGQSILEAVARGAKAPLLKRVPAQRPEDAYLKRLDQLKNWRKKVAAEMGVESDVVLPKPLLTALAESGLENMEAIMQPSPWRLEHFGAQIVQVLGD